MAVSTWIIIFILLPLWSQDLILVDKIAAVVNGKIITISDIEKALIFYPFFRQKNESKARFHTRVLDDLINHKVLYMEYKDDFRLDEGDLEKVQIMVIDKLGSMNNLLNRLSQFNMSWEDFKEYIKEKALYEKILTEKFQMKIAIDFKEIRNIYEKDYIPKQRRLNIAVKPLVEMAPLIEHTLQKRKTTILLAEWLKEVKSSYSIENKLIEEMK